MGLEFEEKKEIPVNFKPRVGRGGIIGLLMRLGIAKNVAQANLILIAVTIVAGVFLYWNLNQDWTPQPQPSTMSDVERLKYPMVKE